jgi:GntR family transcriptional regulator
VLATPSLSRYHARHTSLATVARVETEIDFHGKTPSYQQLADHLRAAIAAGEYGPREAIPSLKQLTQMTGLAQGTVQHAIRILEQEGLVYTVSGRGTFVSPPKGS